VTRPPRPALTAEEANAAAVRRLHAVARSRLLVADQQRLIAGMMARFGAEDEGQDD
jgi:hypothetical protein